MKIRPQFYLATVNLLLLCAIANSSAQTMYRCGTSYQDKPCANGQQGVVIGTQKSRSPEETERLSKIDPACKAKGEEAKKILWMREGGAQKSALLAQATSDEQSQLINDIYAVRGNSNEIRTNIEKSCMEQKDMSKRLGSATDMKTLQALLASQQSQQKNEKHHAGQVENNIQARERNEEQVTTDLSQKKRMTCPNVKTQLEIVMANLRAGADTQTRQVLNQQKQELEKEVTQACAK